MKYKNIPELSTIIHTIDEQHRELHNLYLNIYKIYFLETKRSWVMAMITQSRKKVSADNQKLASTYYSNIEEVSKTLLEALNKLESLLAIQRDELLVALI